MKTIRVGVGAGFSDDRIEPAVDLVDQGALDYLVFECLAERTIARESLVRSADCQKGYSPFLRDRLEAVLAKCVHQSTRIVTNMGAANPPRAAAIAVETARAAGLHDVTVAYIMGDDVVEAVRRNPGCALLETGEPVEALLPNMVSANAYLGADVVRSALDTGAHVVVGGRIADPSLFLGCLLHGHAWDYDDYYKVAAGTVVGHLLECSAQLTGGCFADPGKKHVPNLSSVGFPYADVDAAGEIVVGKLAGSGGCLNVATCTEQLLYEVHDPARYITPDCVLDITGVDLASTGKDMVSVTGAQARDRTDTYKVAVGYHDGWIGVGEIGYAGPNALARARLAEQVTRERLKQRGFDFSEIRADYVGMSSLHGNGLHSSPAEPYEVRLRIAARAQSRRAAEAIGFEVRTLHVNGPAGGGGGVSHSAREVLAIKSLLMPRAWVTPEIKLERTA